MVLTVQVSEMGTFTGTEPLSQIPELPVLVPVLAHPY